MRFLNYTAGGEARLGVALGEAVLDLERLGDSYRAAREPDAPRLPVDVHAFLEAGRSSWALAARALGWAREAGDLEPVHGAVLAAPVSRPGKIVCVGLNYRRHAAESGLAVPTTPMLFSKFNNALAASGEPVPLPQVASQYDYEAELAVVIGRRADRVTEADALGHVFGYCSANDLSARDLQLRTSQFLLGKTLEKFLPLGPYLVTADEVGDPQDLRVRCWLNGELRQDSSTKDMIFGVAEVVSYISRHFPLEPGDLVLTGTPEGVIFGRKDKVWLKAGDEVVVEVEKLGRLVSTMAARA